MEQSPAAERIKAEFQEIVDVVRPRRLGDLIRERFGDSNTSFARHVEIDPTSVTRMRYKPGKKGRKRMGEETVYMIERRCALPRGWLDNNVYASQPPPPPMSPQAVTIALAWDALPDGPLKTLVAALVMQMANRAPPGDPTADPSQAKADGRKALASSTRST